MILVTDGIVWYRQAWGGMIHRCIASVLLATLCWLSVPAAFGPLEVPSAKGFQNDTADDHSCCPRSRPQISPILFLAINSTAMPCGEQHPCCIRPAPLNPSTVPVETKMIRPALERGLALITDTPSCRGGRNVETAALNFPSPPVDRSTVLRI